MLGEVKRKLDIAICDDMLTDADKLRLFLIGIFNLFQFKNIEYEITAHYRSGEDMLASKVQHDILFLDIEMPGGMDGFEASKRLQKRREKPIVMFLTTHDTRGAEGFPAGGFRFLSKNFDEDAFVEALTAAVHKIYTNQRIKIQYKSEDREELTINIIYVNDITHIETDGKCSIIYTKLDQFSSNKSLKYWEDLLPKNRFYRVHTSYLVNFVNVIEIDVKKRWVLLDCEVDGNHEIQIARDRVKAGFEALHDFYRFWGGGVD